MNIQSKCAYLSGFMDGDGEGCFSITHNKNGSRKGFSYACRICIVSTDRRVLEWVKQHFGGVILNRQPKNWKPVWKPSYEWRLTTTKDLEKFILGLLPYLIIKKEQAKTVLEYVRLNGKENPSKREELFQKLRKLNQKGVSLESVTTNTSSLPIQEVKIESELMGDHKSEPVVIQDS